MKSDLQKLGVGAFTWMKDERRTNRYGYFYLDYKTYNRENIGPINTVNIELLEELVGKRVKLIAKVIEHRPSGHVGDLFLGIIPNPQPVGTEVIFRYRNFNL